LLGETGHFPGVLHVIDALFERLQLCTDHNGAPQVLAIQMKEKLGELRFYLDVASDEQWGMIGMAEALSTRICETCGRPGTLLVASGWYMTLCVEHAPECAGVA